MASITTISFNIQWGKIWDEEEPDKAPIRLDKTMEEIRRHDADIIMLQEVEAVTPGMGQLQPPVNYTRLRDELEGYHSYFSYPVSDTRELPFGYGLAIFSRTPLTDTRKVDLPAPPISFEYEGVETKPTDRLLIEAKTNINGNDLQIYNTHLQAFFIINYSSDDYKGQRDRLVAELNSSKIPTLLAGDFNSAPGEGTVAQIESAGYKTAQWETITWRRMPYTLDHIFYNHGLKLKSVEICPTPASDHHVLKAVLEV